MFSSPLSHAEILICGCIFCMVMALCIYLSNNPELFIMTFAA